MESIDLKDNKPVFQHSSQQPIASSFIHLNHAIFTNENSMNEVILSLTVLNPVYWSAEHPYVYSLVTYIQQHEKQSCSSTTSVTSNNSYCIQAESCFIGIRSIQISNEGILTINNHRVVIRGVNLHEHDHLFGHTTTFTLTAADIILMKRHNFNAIRTSHYPHQSWLYDLCTLYGMYVIDEANIETHGMVPYVGRLADDPAWRDAYMLRLQRMFLRDKNHGCIIGWSLGNESGYGEVHDLMADWIRTKDTSRILCYEPASFGPRDVAGNKTFDKHVVDNLLNGCYQNKTATDILCPMYARVHECTELLRMFPSKPLILCEYSHMMGNSGGNLDLYWDAFHRHSRMQGGFIWDWVDQGISTKSDVTGRMIWAYGGDFHEISHDRNFCLNGLIWPDRGLGWAQGVRYTDNYNNSTTDHIMSINDDSFGLSSRVSENEMQVQNRKKQKLNENRTIENNILDLYPWKKDGKYEDFLKCIDDAMVKPTLLEAKQCQKPFLCRVINTDITRNFDIIGNSPSEKNDIILTYSIIFEIYNLYDHMNNINHNLCFESYLIVNGIINNISIVQSIDQLTVVPSPSILCSDNRSYYSVSFNISIYECDSLKEDDEHRKFKTLIPPVRKSTDMKYLLRGITWSPTTLLASNMNQNKNDAKEDWVWTHIDQQSSWSVIVLARTKHDASWSPVGYPLGFEQCALNTPNIDLLLRDKENHTQNESKIQENNNNQKNEINSCNDDKGFYQVSFRTPHLGQINGRDKEGLGDVTMIAGKL